METVFIIQLMICNQLQCLLEGTADLFSPSPSPSSDLTSASFLFPALEKENLVSFLPPSRPFPGRLFLSALLYGLNGFLPPGFPPNLVPAESGQSETPWSQTWFNVLTGGHGRCERRFTFSLSFLHELLSIFRRKRLLGLSFHPNMREKWRRQQEDKPAIRNKDFMSESHKSR